MANTGSYIPPQSPIAIQPGDKGFEIIGKGYNRWLWTYPDWKKKKKKIINPNTNWELNAKPMSPSEIKKKMKDLYLEDDTKETPHIDESIFVDKIQCDGCGWSWLKKDGGDDLYICHKCGNDNSKSIRIGEGMKNILPFDSFISESYIL